jgi:hypothetical protein
MESFHSTCRNSQTTVIKTYVLNLREATERRRFMEARLGLFPFLDVEFVPAIRGSDVSRLDLSRLVDETACIVRVGREPCSGKIRAEAI